MPLLADERPLRLFLRVGSFLGWVWGEEFLGVRLGPSDSSPDGSGDGGDGVGGEGGTPTGVVALERPPEAHTTRL